MRRAATAVQVWRAQCQIIMRITTFDFLQKEHGLYMMSLQIPCLVLPSQHMGLTTLV